MGRKVAETAEYMRYYSKSSGDLSNLRIRALMIRWKNFQSVHEKHMKMAVQMRGPGLF